MSCPDCDQICADHTGRGEQLNGLNERFKLLLGGISFACFAILAIQGVNYTKLSSIEKAVTRNEIINAQYELRLQRVEQELNRFHNSISGNN